MKQHSLLHISDTIQSSKDISLHDTTVDRLALWYEILAEKIGVQISGKREERVQFVGSEFGNSLQTGAQAIALLESGKYSETQVLLINNASRAKHEHSNNAKGSGCLWAQVEIDGVTHHLVGVDDEAFTFILPYLKKGTKVQIIHSVSYNDPENDIQIQIDDLSQGTQFRSKEHFPVAQLILLKKLQDKKGPITPEDFQGIFALEDKKFHISGAYIQNFRKRLVDCLDEAIQGTSLGEVMRAYIEQIKKDCEIIIQQGGATPTYTKHYLPGFVGIEKVQLLGELALLREKFGIYTPHDERNFGLEAETLALYTRSRKQLAKNQVMLIDRDKFGNGIFTYNEKFNGIHSLVHANGLGFTKKENIETQKPLTITGGGVTFQTYATETISDLTGKNCLWQSSSRGPSGEKLLNINTSINGSYKVLEEIQNLPIGTILTIES